MPTNRILAFLLIASSICLSLIVFSSNTLLAQGSSMRISTKPRKTLSDSENAQGKRKKVDQDSQRKKDDALGAGAYRTQRYGERGETIDGSESYSKEFGKIGSTSTSSLGKTTTYGQTRTGEVRSRTYKDRLDLRNGDSSAAVGAEAQASVVRAEYGVSNSSPDVIVGGVAIRNQQQASVDAFVGSQAQAGASLDLGSDPQVSVGAGVFVGAKVQADASNKTTVLGASSTQSGRAHASAGAEADAGASVGLSGADAEAGAFAGARAGASGSVEVAGVEGGGTAEAWAGVGARGKAEAGYDDGKLKLEFGAGAAVGVGGSVNTSVSIDVAKSVNDVRAIDRNAGRAVNRSTRKIGSSLKNRSRQIGQLSPIRTLPRTNFSGFQKPKNRVSRYLKPNVKMPVVKKPRISKPKIRKPKIKVPKIKSPFGR